MSERDLLVGDRVNRTVTVTRRDMFVATEGRLVDPTSWGTRGNVPDGLFDGLDGVAGYTGIDETPDRDGFGVVGRVTMEREATGEEVLTVKWTAFYGYLF